MRTLLADGPPARKAIDAAPPREHRLPPSGFRWWNGVLAGRSVGVLAALVAVVAIVGYLYHSRPWNTRVDQAQLEWTRPSASSCRDR